MSNYYPQNQNSLDRGRDLVARRSKEVRKKERRMILGTVAGGIALGAALLVGAHNRDSVALEQQAKAEQAKSVVVGVSNKTVDVKAKAGDIVGSLVRDNSDIVNDDPTNVRPEVAFDAAVDEVEAMPENAKVLADHTLQIGEHLVVPTEITVTTEAKINQGK